MRLRSDSVSASSSAMPGWAYGTLSKPETAMPLFSRGVSITVRRLERLHGSAGVRQHYAAIAAGLGPRRGVATV